MNKEETHFIVQVLVSLHLISQGLEELHKTITNFVIQKGTKNAENPDDFEIRRN